MFLKKSLFALCAVVGATCAFALGEHPTPGIGHDNNARYATDAYPGFDKVDEILKPERKEPKWFAFINGPNRAEAKSQFEYCQSLEREGNFKKAAKHYDALVREWPTSPEASKAQQRYAELLLNELDDAEEAFRAYRYLLDFYSSRCKYDEMVDRLYHVANTLRIEGKEVMFIRFANTVEVRRAYEACVLHAPGAKWVPEAMLIIAQLREDEGKFAEGIRVFENLRNLYPDSSEAKIAIYREAVLRMKLLREHEYNRSRCRDVIDYLKLALRTCRPEDAVEIQAFLNEANGMIEREAYVGAKFYDSPTRTKRSAINAYEKFLREYPNSEHAEEISARLEQLKQGETK